MSSEVAANIRVFEGVRVRSYSRVPIRGPQPSVLIFLGAQRNLQVGLSRGLRYRRCLLELKNFGYRIFGVGSSLSVCDPKRHMYAWHHLSGVL